MAGSCRPANHIHCGCRRRLFSDPRFLQNAGYLPQPAVQFRKEFEIQKPVSHARLYVTALGAYRAYLNGHQIGKDILTPGFTGFPKRLLYQTYDVTPMLSQGRNTIGALLGDGWFASSLSWTAVHFPLAPVTRVIAQLEIEYADGTLGTVGTDQTWKASPSPILHSEIYAGETYDARLEQPGWSKSGFADTSWTPAQFADEYAGTISSQPDTPPQVVTTLKPERVMPGPDGSYIYDMGQNMVGWARLNVNGAPGNCCPDALCRDPEPGWQYLHGESAQRRRHRLLHSARRRRRVIRAGVYLPRLPLHRTHRLSR